MKHLCTALLATTALIATASMTLAAGKHRLVLTSEAGDRASPIGQAMQTWAANIDDLSDGRIKVDIFYQGELGGQQELFDQFVRGNVDMMITWPQTSYDQRMAVNFIPYTVMGWDDAIVSYGRDGWLTQLVQPVYADMGLHYFGDQLDYFVQSSHYFSTFYLLMNNDSFQELDAEDQAILTTATEAVIDAQFAAAKTEDDKWIAEAQARGMEYIVPTPEQKLAWIDRVRAEVWPQIEAVVGQEIMDQVRANASTPK